MNVVERKFDRLDQFLEDQKRIEHRISQLVEEAINDITEDFKDRYGFCIFQSTHLQELLSRNNDWRELNVGRGTFYRSIRKLGWQRGVMRFKGLNSKRIKIWTRPYQSLNGK